MPTSTSTRGADHPMRRDAPATNATVMTTASTSSALSTPT